MQGNYFIRALLVGVTSLCFTGCTDIVEPPQKSEPSALPSITKSTTGQLYQGKFVWHDLLTDDMESARKFYGDVFGWRFETKRDYTQIYNQKELIGGIMQVTPSDEQQAKAVWLPSISVANVDKSVEQLLSQQGKVLKGPIYMKERGKGVLISDPHGAHVVLLRAKGGDPKDKTPQIGDWLWNELWTNKPKESYAFYRHLAGYDGYEMRDGYQILKRKNKWRAGIREIDKDEFKARWVPAIRVSDLQETILKVNAAGGEVIISPDKELENGNVALIKDTTGAVVIIQYWEEGGA
jgi:predicted enzyme related to lactoylglutathione lyase